MLALSLKPGESVAIGPQIVVKVLGVQGHKVQLGIAAPKDIKIVRPDPGSSPVRK